MDKSLRKATQQKYQRLVCVREMDALDQAIAAQVLGAARDRPHTAARRGRLRSWTTAPPTDFDAEILRISPGAVLGNRACRESSCASATNPGSHSLTSAAFGAIRYIALQCGKGRWGNCQ
ncbi:MAG: hypothetical protein ACREYC_28480 [Gammaproteobacteria bacterium]